MEHFRQEDIDELFTDLKVIGSIRQHQRAGLERPLSIILDGAAREARRRRAAARRQNGSRC